MKIENIFRLFRTVYNECTDEGITEAEFSGMFNMAMYSLIGEELNDLEKCQQNLTNWAPLLYTPDEETHSFPDTGGFLKYSEIQKNFPDSIERDEEGIICRVTKPDIIHILSVDRWDGKKFRRAKWVRFNDTMDNPKRRPTQRFPRFRIKNEGIQMYPSDDAMLRIVAIRHPISAWLDPNDATNNVDPELSESIVFRVVLRALQLLGISSNSQRLYNLARDTQ